MPVLNTTSRNLRRYSTKLVKDVINLVVDSGTELEVLATRDAPKFVHIDKKADKGGKSVEVGVFGENEIAAYFEFGTGLSAVKILAPYPQWIKDIAMQFYINGKGTLQGKPYLFNNFLVIERKFIKELNNILDGRFNDN